MNRLLLVLIFALAVTLAWAQEIPGEDFSARQVNKRYEITFYTPMNAYFRWDYYDAYLYARVPNTSSWFKAKAIAGSYEDLPENTQVTLLWEPILDYHKLMNYDFRLFLVNKHYLNTGYKYDATTQIGLLTLYSDMDDMDYKVNDEGARFRLPLALPFGQYEVSMYSGETQKTRKTITLSQLDPPLEVDLTPKEGYLTLSAVQKNVKYMVGDQIYSSVQNMTLPVGPFSAQAVLEDPVTGKHTLDWAGTIGFMQTSSHSFDFQFGYLALSSNQANISYAINGKRFSAVDNIALPAGRYDVSATYPEQNALLKNYVISVSLEIKPAVTTKHLFEFQIGKLTLASSENGTIYTINGSNFNSVNELPLRAGQYQVSAILPKDKTGSPDFFIKKDVVIIADQVTKPENFSFTNGWLTLTSNIPGVTYTMYNVAYPEVKDLKLRPGYHVFFALPPKPYEVFTDIVYLEPNEHKNVPVEFIRTKEIIAADRRVEFGHHFKNVILAVTEVNHYFTLDKSGNSGLAYKPLGNGISISGLRFRAWPLSSKETDLLYDIKYPQAYLGFGLCDQLIIANDTDSGQTGLIFDFISINAGLTHISKSGLFYGQMDLIGYWSIQPDLYKKLGNDENVREPVEESYNQFAGEIKCQLGCRLFKYNYLHLNLGARVQGPSWDNWKTDDLSTWLNVNSSAQQSPSKESFLPKTNSMFDGLSFYIGIGLDNSLFLDPLELGHNPK